MTGKTSDLRPDGTDSMTDFDDRIARVNATLSDEIGPTRVHSAGRSYENTRQRIYNAGIDFAPRLVVTPEKTSEVGATVLATVEHDLTLSVLGGGNDWPGRSVRGDVVIDLTRMQQV